MKLIKLCMIVGLGVTGMVSGKNNVKLTNEETEAILQKIKEREEEERELVTLQESTEHNHEAIARDLEQIRNNLKNDRALLGLPHPEPGKNWTKIILTSAGILTLTAATGGLASGGIALIIKGSACTAIQLGGAAAGSLVGAHGIGQSLHKEGDVDFDTIARKTVPKAAAVGLIVGGSYALGAGGYNGFDGGLGGVITTYLQKSKNGGEYGQPARREMDPTQQFKQQKRKGKL